MPGHCCVKALTGIAMPQPCTVFSNSSALRVASPHYLVSPAGRYCIHFRVPVLLWLHALLLAHLASQGIHPLLHSKLHTTGHRQAQRDRRWRNMREGRRAKGYKKCDLYYLKSRVVLLPSPSIPSSNACGMSVCEK